MKKKYKYLIYLQPKRRLSSEGELRRAKWSKRRSFTAAAPRAAALQRVARRGARTASGAKRTSHGGSDRRGDARARARVRAVEASKVESATRARRRVEKERKKRTGGARSVIERSGNERCTSASDGEGQRGSTRGGERCGKGGSAGSGRVRSTGVSAPCAASTRPSTHVPRTQQAVSRETNRKGIKVQTQNDTQMAQKRRRAFRHFASLQQEC